MIQADESGQNNAKGKALEILTEAGLDPFAQQGGTSNSHPRLRLLDYSAHAAMIVGLIGFAWTVGAHVVHRTPSSDGPAKVAALVSDPVTDLRDRNRELADNVHALQERLDALQATVGDQSKVAGQVRALQAGLDSVKTTLGATRSEGSAAMARLDGKIDKISRDPNSRIQQLVDRLGKLEHVGVDATPTASIPRASERTELKAMEARPVDAKPVPRPADHRNVDKDAGVKAAASEEFAKPQIINTWVVRNVYQGVALIEGRRGTLEVVPGVSIPGAGVVKSIDRHGAGWTVTTTKGLVAYSAPARDYRRADRGYYGYGGPAYNEDF